MKIFKTGLRFGNAEIDIDIILGKVDFRYPNINPDVNLSFFTNSLFIYIGVIVGFMVSLYSIKPFVYILKNNNLIFFMFSLWYLLCMFGSIVFFGYLSIFLHRHSKIIRDSFPLTNAFIYRVFYRKWKYILSNLSYGKNYIFVENKLYFFDYSIIFFEYMNKTNAKIERIYTRTVEKLSHNSEHFKFILIMEFNKRPTEGMIEWR